MEVKMKPFPLLSWKAQLQQNFRSNHQRAFLWFYYISPLNMASFIRQEITTCPPYYPRLQSSTNQREREGGGSNSTPGADIAQCAGLFFLIAASFSHFTDKKTEAQRRDIISEQREHGSSHLAGKHERRQQSRAFHIVAGASSEA